MFRFFASDFFNFEFLRVIGAAPFQGAEIAECLDARSRITDGDPESWYRAWRGAAERASSRGDEALLVHDSVAARWAYLRASNYWRASEFFLHCTPGDARILAAIEASARAFDKAADLMEGEVIKLEIPYGDVKLPARLFMPPPDKRLKGKVPLILHMGGFDSTGEELYFYGAAGAMPRGYATLAFDGPGQGLLLRKEPTCIRPDWEVVTGQVVSYVIDVLIPGNPQLDIDERRIAVLGASLGGYLALRAAADPRIAACVSCDGCYDMFDVTRSRMPSWFINSWLGGRLGDGVFNWVVDTLCKYNFQTKWEFAHSKWVYGVDSPANVMRAMQKFTLRSGEKGEGEYLHQVRCSTMVTGAADTFYFVPELNAERIFRKLDHIPDEKKVLWVGRAVDGGNQAKIASLSEMHQRMFAWLDVQFDMKRGIS
jgi:pimeloyl-ACP methyl ester carboxylesterase